MLSRVTAARRIPRAFVAPMRTYTTSRTEGSVAQSKEFSYVAGFLACSPDSLSLMCSVRDLQKEGEGPRGYVFYQRPWDWCLVVLDQFIRKHEAEQLAKLKAEVRGVQCLNN